jgi:hypothetical protein
MKLIHGNNSSFKYNNNNNSIQSFIHLHVYTTAQRPIIKESGAKLESTKHIHTNKDEPNQTKAACTIINIQ